MNYNLLIVIENGTACAYELDGKSEWTIGRSYGDNVPDIKLTTKTISRIHGSLRNIDDVWFYYDHNSKNGTTYNGEGIKRGIKGRYIPKELRDGDILILGGNGSNDINSMTVAMVYKEELSDNEEITIGNHTYNIDGIKVMGE